MLTIFIDLILPITPVVVAVAVAEVTRTQDTTIATNEKSSPNPAN